MATNSDNPYLGKDTTPEGIMPPDHLARHKLAVNTPGDVSFRRPYKHNRLVKRIFEQTKRYRQFVHGVNEDRLATPLRLAVHYLISPMSRGSSGGAGSNYSTPPAQETDDSLDAVQQPLKV